MSATTTALRVVEWALAPEGPPPGGDLRQAEALARPSPELAERLGQLAAVTAARLRLAAPPLGDGAPLAAETAVLAAALGSLQTPALAAALAGALGPARHPAEWVTRHGLAGSAVPYLPAAAAEPCMAASPLTALIERPAPGGEAAALQVANRLLADPAGRLALKLRLARPATDPSVRRWRAALLDRLRLADVTGAAAAGEGPGEARHRSFVLDVYEAAMVHHEPEHLQQLRWARSVILDPLAAADDSRLFDALAVAEWWGPLAAIERGDVDALRTRRYLGYAYRQGLELHRLARRLRGGVA